MKWKRRANARLFHFNHILDLKLLPKLSKPNNKKIVLLVLDGLGGLPLSPGGPTELEAARTPLLDQLTLEGALGEIVPVRPGVTPGSGAATLALLGYDPMTSAVGRGALEARGVDLPVSVSDVAARGNFCSIDSFGQITDRRAGRLSSAKAVPLVSQLSKITVPGAEFDIRHLKHYRFAIVLRGTGLNSDITDTDPQQIGLPPLPAVARSETAEPSASLVNQWIGKAQTILSNETTANMVTLRGFSCDPKLPTLDELYSLKAGCVAVYPLYRGVARITGMNTIPITGTSPAEHFASLRTQYSNYDFFFVHIKETDTFGEDGDFDGKVDAIERIDTALQEVLELDPDVLVVTGDHSTPSRMRSHSWHPVPLLLWAPATARQDTSTEFGERTCSVGSLGRFPATEVMPLMLAHAERLEKFGA